MDTATTAPEMEHRALLARVREGPDKAAAAAVTAFAGDINAFGPGKEETVLYTALTCACARPLTIAALAARGDCNPNAVNAVTRFRVPVLCRLAGWCSYQTEMATFLAHFPTLNVDACDASGDTPLHYAIWGHETNAQLLLDAGADPTIRSLEGRTPAQDAHNFGGVRSIKLLEAAEAWHNSLRRGWLRAVVGISKNIAV